MSGSNGSGSDYLMLCFCKIARSKGCAKSCHCYLVPLDARRAPQSEIAPEHRAGGQVDQVAKIETK